MRPGVLRGVFLLAALLAGVTGLQFAYDRVKPPAAPGQASGFSPEVIRLFDLGFHSTMASALWVSTMPEILDLFHGKKEYFADRAFLSAVDPKLSYPYAFSVLTLPVVPNLPEGVAMAQAIGQEGIANSDPDWRIPYYMAINYYLQLKDLKDALWYFNLAANTPGVPSYAARFSLNFGIEQKERDRVRGIWATVYQSSNDEATKARAAAYIERLNDFDLLESAAGAYKQKYGTYPASPDDLVKKGILPSLPLDPFGFTFVLKSDGTAGIDLAKLPGYLLTEPAQ